MAIRLAELADAVVIARLHTRSWQSAYRGILRDDFLEAALPENHLLLWHERLSQSERSEQFVLVDEEAGAIRGFACAFLDADPVWGCLLDNLHVVPELKGQGFGRHLMSAVAQRVCRMRPRGRLHLWAYELNLGARRFYERLGGVMEECHTEPAPDGSRLKALRYCWSDLSELAALRG